MARKRTGEHWVGVECVACGAECKSARDAESFSFRIGKTKREDSIACARGRGCNRRKPSDERRPHPRRVEYKHGGYWFSAEQLARANDVSAYLVRSRLAAGWTVADAIGPRASSGVALARSKSDYETRSALAVIAAGGAGSPQLRRALSRAALPDFERGPGRVSRHESLLSGRPVLTANAIAVACQCCADWVRDRARALGSLEAVVLEIASKKSAQKRKKRVRATGRTPVLGVPLGLAAIRTGVTRQALWKAAKRNGRTTAEELVARLAANGEGQVAA